jgi:methylenetetrahydrofolate dehydrogenase (NADP+)/methenyltetrahydrofolate cyclohydrolase
LPLPEQIDEQKSIAVDPSKDVDGFHPEFWKNGFRHDYFIPATPLEFGRKKDMREKPKVNIL